MAVASIIAILASILLPRFGRVIRASNEGTTKANLKTLRSALQLYYSLNDGIYPYDLSPLQQPGNRYVKAFPKVTTATHGTSTSVEYPSDYDNTLDGGGWGYAGNGSEPGKVWVACTHTDLANGQWNQY